jgi:glycosyltransferase involved in cell wall biosynthesis
MSEPRLCAVVPTHNHWRVLGDVVSRLHADGLAVFVVDDGSTQPARAAIAALDAPQDGIVVVRHDTNQGKGAAVLAGFARAGAAGFTHALQVDADGQHDLSVLARLLDAARRHPDTLVCGAPVYDASAPAARRIGRQVTRFWVAVETLCLRLPDTMCGLRVYPLAAVDRLIARMRLGRRMEFDTDILVRLVRDGVPLAVVPVTVRYDAANLSNFALFADNWRISRMHARLVLELPWYALRLLRHRPIVLHA